MNKIYVQVLLLDNKIESWKIGETPKDDVDDFKAYWKLDRLHDYTMETIVFEKNTTVVESGWDFSSYVNKVLGPQWINQWEYADDYKGFAA